MWSEKTLTILKLAQEKVDNVSFINKNGYDKENFMTTVKFTMAEIYNKIYLLEGKTAQLPLDLFKLDFEQELQQKDVKLREMVQIRNHMELFGEENEEQKKILRDRILEVLHDVCEINSERIEQLKKALD